MQAKTRLPLRHAAQLNLPPTWVFCFLLRCEPVFQSLPPFGSRARRAYLWWSCPPRPSSPWPSGAAWRCPRQWGSSARHLPPREPAYRLAVRSLALDDLTRGRDWRRMRTEERPVGEGG